MQPTAGQQGRPGSALRWGQAPCLPLPTGQRQRWARGWQRPLSTVSPPLGGGGCWQGTSQKKGQSRACGTQKLPCQCVGEENSRYKEKMGVLQLVGELQSPRSPDDANHQQQAFLSAHSGCPPSTDHITVSEEPQKDPRVGAC